MKPDHTRLIEIAGIKTPLIGFYDVPDTRPFEPMAILNRCLFSAYENWLRGESVCISVNGPICRGGNYWIGGAEYRTPNELAIFLTKKEGFALQFSKRLHYQS